MKYTVWMEGYEGWFPVNADTLEDCFTEMHERAHGGKFRITKDVDYAMIEMAE